MYIVISTKQRLVPALLKLFRKHSVRVIGVYREPVKFCECPEAQRQNWNHWRRGKSGIPIHSGCGRPSPHWANVEARLEVALGKRVEDEQLSGG